MKNITCHPEARRAEGSPKASVKRRGFFTASWRFRMTEKERGFTLVELIVVIVIIGIVAGLVTANLIGVRQRARDAQRKSDLRQIQAALELYRADAGSYPLADNFPACGNQFVSGTAVYMQKIPCDPVPFGANRNYIYTSSSGSGSTYDLIACLENANDLDRSAVGSVVSMCILGTGNFGPGRANPFWLKNP